MSVFVFTGPTLSPEKACAELDAIYLPPVSQGDVYRAALKRPRAIGIIDGYFECVPAVWHKEILWAMTEGIHVYGSASMGALRAVELADADQPLLLRFAVRVLNEDGQQLQRRGHRGELQVRGHQDAVDVLAVGLLALGASMICRYIYSAGS